MTKHRNNFKRKSKKLLTGIITATMSMSYAVSGASNLLIYAETSGENSLLSLSQSSVLFSTSYYSSEQIAVLQQEDPNVQLSTITVKEFIEGVQTTQNTIYFAEDVSVLQANVGNGYRINNAIEGMYISKGQNIEINVDLSLIRTYVVNFDANGSTGTMIAQSISGQDIFVIPENQFTKENASFIGFNTSPDGSGQMYQPLMQLSLSGNLTLYPIFQEHQSTSTETEKLEDVTEKQKDETNKKNADEQSKDDKDEEVNHKDNKEQSTDLKSDDAIDPKKVEENEKTYYEVKFYDEKLNLITHQYIESGHSAVAPHCPMKNEDEKIFVGWYTNGQGSGYPVTDFTNIEADQEFYAIYRDEVRHEIKINYQFKDGTEAAKPYVAGVIAGSDYKDTVVSPTIEGYSADQKQIEINLKDIQEDKDYFVVYTGEKQEYTVSHKLENLEGKYVEKDKETLEGDIGQFTQAKAKKYEGFTAESVKNTKITPDGDINIEINYSRNRHTLTYNTLGGSYIQSKSVLFEDKIRDLSQTVPTKLGYQFKGWSLTEDGKNQISDETTMPNANTTLYAIWQEETKADYTIVYWLENLSGGYDYIDSTIEQGDVGESIPNGNFKDWSGVNIEANGVQRDTTKDQTVTITSDGRAVKNVYYQRKTFTIKFYEKEGLIFPNWVENKALCITAKYGKDISKQWETACEDSAWGPEKDGNTQYTLFANMPAKDLVMYEKDSGTGTTITYYVEGLNNERVKYAEFKASYFVSLTPEDKQPIEGFTFDSWQKENKPLWLYYKRNSYTIFFENCIGIQDASIKFEQKIGTKKPTGEIGRPEGIDEDYVFAGWYTSPAFEKGTEVDWESKMPAHNVQLYAKWEVPEYTVQFDLNEGTGDAKPITVKKYETIVDKMPEDPTKENDEFEGWFIDKELTEPFIHNVQIVNDMTLYAKWSSSDTFDYTILYVDENGDPIEGIEPEHGHAEKGSYIVLDPKDIDNYEAVDGESTERLDQPNQVFEIEYRELETWSFIVKFVDENGKEIANSIKQDIPEQTQQFMVNAPTEATPGFNDFDHYKLISAPQIEVSQDDVKAHSGDYVVYFEYTHIEHSYVVNHIIKLPNKEVTYKTAKENGELGDYITVDPLQINGYKCISSKLQRSGVVQDNDALVINVYYEIENNVVIEDYEGTYDGQSHGLDVQGITDMSRVRYSTDGVQYTDTMPTYKDVNTANEKGYVVYTKLEVKINDEWYEASDENVEEHYIKINPKSVEVTAPSVTKQYDGMPLNTWAGTDNYEDATSDGFVKGEGFKSYYYTGDSTRTTVGETDNKFDESRCLNLLNKNTKATNYHFTWTPGKITITDRTEKYLATIKAKGTSVEYNGKEQSVEGFEAISLTDKEGKDLSSTYTVGLKSGEKFITKAIDAGKYDVELNKEDIVIKDKDGNDVTDQFEIKTVNAIFEITQKPITIQAGSKNFDYKEGESHSFDESTIIHGELVDGHRYEATIEGSVEQAGESKPNKITKVVIFDENDKDVTANYDIETMDGILTVTNPTATVTAKITIKSMEEVYNGESQSATDVGYDISFTSDDKYDFDKWTINGDTISTSRTNVGTSVIDFEDRSKLQFIASDGSNLTNNVDVIVTTGKLTITPRPIEIKADSASKEYDGTYLTKNTYTHGKLANNENSGLVGSDKIESVLIKGSVLLGEADNVISNAVIKKGETNVTRNYDVHYTNGELKVTNDDKESRVITYSLDNVSKTYDGKALMNRKLSVDGKVLGADKLPDIKDIKVTGSQTDYGESDNIIDKNSIKIMNGNVDVTDAYSIQIKNAKLIVNQRPITLRAQSKSKPFDGTALKAPDIEMDAGSLAETDKFVQNGEQVDQLQAKDSIVDVGNVYNRVPEFDIQGKDGISKKKNYKVTSINGLLTITPAKNSTHKINFDSLTTVYNGKPQALKNAESETNLETDTTYKENTTITYSIDGGKTWTETMPTKIDAGLYKVIAKAYNPNYADAEVTKELIISKRPVTIRGKKGQLEYNGKEQIMPGATSDAATENTGLVTGHTFFDVEAWAKGTNVRDNQTYITPSTDVKIKDIKNNKDVTNNYSITTVPGSIEITPKPITLSSKSKEAKYNGKSLKEHVIDKKEGLLEKDTLIPNFTGSQTDIGTSKNTFTVNVVNEEQKNINRNYTITYKYGDLTVYAEIVYHANKGKGEAPEPYKYYSGKKYIVEENMFTKEGYTFDSWNTRAAGNGNKVNENFEIHSLRNNLNLYAQWIPNTDTKYVVEQYLEKDGKYANKADKTIEHTGTTDETVSVSQEDKTAPKGYALDTEANNVFDGKVAADGTLVLKVYFAKDEIGPDGPDEIPDKYQVQFTYVAKENGKVTGTTKEIHTFKDDEGNLVLPTPIRPDAKVTAVANDGYEIDTWLDGKSNNLGNGEKPKFGEITYKENETFTVSFKELEHVTIKYQAKSHGKVSLDSETLNPETGESKGSKAIADKGYSFDGWYLEDKKLSKDEQFKPSKEDGRYKEATYVAKFVPNTDTEYVVEQYFEKDGKYADKADKSFEYKGTTGKEVSVSQKDMAAPTGYVLDENAENLFTGKVAADGSLVLKVYFVKDEIGPDGPDEIPDKYQVQFTYVAKENGKVTGTVNEVHTFKDKDGNYVLPTPVTPNAEVKAIANDGYEIDIWKDASGLELGNKENPEFANKKYSRSQIFTVSFKEKSETEKPKPETESDKPDDDKKNDEKDDKKDEVNTSTQTNRSLFTAMAISALGAIGILNFLKKKKED